MRLNRMASAVWAVYMEQATGGDQGGSSGAAGSGDAAAAAAASAAAAAGGDGSNANAGANSNANANANAAGGSGANAGGNQSGQQQQSGAPEKYELKLPEKTTLTQADVDAVSTFAKDKKLTNEQAQMLLEQRHEAATATTTAAQAKLTEIKTGWINELKSDTEFGGANLDANDAHATKAIKAFGGDELLKSIKDAGFNQHPGFFRMMARIGKAMAEDKPLNQGATGGSGGAKDAATVLYGGSS